MFSNNAKVVAPEVPDTIKQLKLAETYFNHSVSCLVLLDRDYNFLRVNQAYADACRRDINDFVGHNHFELYPSDTKLIFDEVLRSKQAFVTFTRAFEFADQPERGVTYWDWTLVPVLDAKGDIEFLVFSLVEVTERKRAEAALRIAAQVYENSSEAMLVTDAAGKIIATNEAFTQVTGFAADEVLGKIPGMLQEGRQPAELDRAIAQALADTGCWQGELWDQTKGGKLIAIRLTINTVCNDAGAVDRRVLLFSDITEKKQTEALIWNQANFDALTKLPNRYLFRAHFQRHLEQARNSGAAVTVLLVDLDQFKEVNDTLGHDKGDVLLVEVARRILACVNPPQTVARLGGDEFAIVLSCADEIRDASLIATRIIDALALPYQLDGDTAFVSASIGIARFPNDGAEVDELLRHADQAMYAAKGTGRNRFCYFTNAMQDAIQTRHHLSNDLRYALARQELEVHYQPIVDMATGTICKAEALLRWRHPTRGLVSPDIFIPLAEASGMIVDMGDWVCRQAVGQLQRLRSLGMWPFQISVNMSPVQFQSNSDLKTAWQQHLAACNLPAQSIVIEITEGLLLDLTPEVRAKLLAFRDAGIQLSLDDFGTGYSSLAYLKKFEIHYLKIDQTFVHNLEPGSNDAVLCEAIIVMAHKLGLKVIAEGVESAAQRDFLAAAGCDLAQGFLFSRALPSQQFEALVAAAGG